MLSSRSTSEVGEEGADDDPDDDVDNEAKAVEALNFRLWATAGVPSSVLPLAW